MASDSSGRTDAADSAIDAVGVLSETSRRRMFAFIRRARRAVTRDEAAASVGISRKLAAFHLDKLVDAGLLRARYESPGGVRKVGRQPKVYEPTGAQIQVSIPGRRHELLAGLLLDAVLTEGEDEDAAEAALRSAERRGREMGASARESVRPGRVGVERGLTACEPLLESGGYEPYRETPTCLRLRNCPFHPLAERAPELVCRMNQAFLGGYLKGLGIDSVQAVLAPSPGECCVRLTPQDADPAAPGCDTGGSGTGVPDVEGSDAGTPGPDPADPSDPVTGPSDAAPAAGPSAATCAAEPTDVRPAEPGRAD